MLIAIEDTRPGIPAAIRDRLFEPFVTAGDSQGPGLGSPSVAKPYSTMLATCCVNQRQAHVWLSGSSACRSGNKVLGESVTLKRRNSEMQSRNHIHPG